MTTETVRIWVDLVPMGRTVGWVGRCTWCKVAAVPQRNKRLATELAMAHSKNVHGGRGVLVVKK